MRKIIYKIKEPVYLQSYAYLLLYTILLYFILWVEKDLAFERKKWVVIKPSLIDVDW